MNSTAMQEKIPAASKNNYAIIVENLNVAEAKKAGPFLDGCLVSLKNIFYIIMIFSPIIFIY